MEVVTGAYEEIKKFATPIAGRLSIGYKGFVNSQASVTWLICAIVSCFYCVSMSKRMSLFGCMFYQFFAAMIVLILFFSYPELKISKYVTGGYIPDSIISLNIAAASKSSTVKSPFFTGKPRPVEIY